MARALILHLDCESVEALRIFEDQILVRISNDTPDDIRRAVTANHNVLKLATLDLSAISENTRPLKEDRIEVAKVASDTLVARAHDAARTSQYREALSLFWANLLQACDDFSWSSINTACGRLASQCAAVGWYWDALFYGVFSGDETLVQDASRRYLTGADSAHTREIISRTLNSFPLLAHRAIACNIASELGELISDDELDAVFLWLLQGAKRNPNDRRGAAKIEKLWAALVELTYRWRPAQATIAIEAVLVLLCYK